MELVTNGARLLHINRRRVAPIAGLGPRQLQWLIDRGWIDRRRVQRLAGNAVEQQKEQG
jgi:hypothetical protein